ncbi:integrase, catalytic region, zinc finger, CCHC-type containing protein [Tanacetum coccineum]|uniref:Integrase, catalytic region, zinc finger, CCHC-type containing protein n=1 Tax=Tanacetum coccineum TaxID=301880 RepID=A0ABQ5EVP3_9ASTR
MAKASPTQAWLWHRRLSHLNFDYINLLSKKDVVIGLPKIKIQHSITTRVGLLFGPLYDEFFNTGTSRVNKSSSPTANSIQQDTLPSTNIHSTSEPSTPTNVHAEENNDDQAEFTNPLCTPVQEAVESSLCNFGNPIQKPVQTRRKLPTDPEMCMFALTVRTAEPKNIKEAMIDSAWIEAMQEELHQFDRLQSWNVVDKPSSRTFMLHTNQDGISFDPDHPEKVYRLRKALYKLKQSSKSMAKYTLEILKKHGTPMATKPKLDADLSGEPVDQTDYRSKIGSLMYLTSSRPDIVQADSGFELTTFSDVDHAGCIDTRKSTSGGIQFLELKYQFSYMFYLEPLPEERVLVSLSDELVVMFTLSRTERLVLTEPEDSYKVGDGDTSFQLKSDSLPHAHAQTTKTYYKHQDSSIKKAQVLKTKTSANSDKQDLPLRYQVYQGRLLASFQDDAKYEHVGQDTRSQGGKDDQDRRIKI